MTLMSQSCLTMAYCAPPLPPPTDSNPNLQNLPKFIEESETGSNATIHFGGRPIDLSLPPLNIRSAFVGPKHGGGCLLAIDYGQIEMRVMAHMSGDASLVALFHRAESDGVRIRVWGGSMGVWGMEFAGYICTFHKWLLPLVCIPRPSTWRAVVLPIRVMTTAGGRVRHHGESGVWRPATRRIESATAVCQDCMHSDP